MVNANAIKQLQAQVRDLESKLAEREREVEALRDTPGRAVSDSSDIRLLREATESNGEALFVRDVAENRMVYVNAAYQRLWGQPREELYADPNAFLRAVHPEDRDRVLAALGRQNDEGLLFDEEYRIIPPDGDVRWVHARAFVSAIEGGVPRRVAGFAEDVTDHKNAVVALENERDFIRRLLNTARAVILVLDPEGRIVQYNPYLEEVTGIALDDVRGRSWFETFIPEDERRRIQELFEVAIRGTATRGNANAILTRDGARRQIEWHDTTLLDDNGTPVGILAIGIDVTDRLEAEKKLQEALQTLEARVEQRSSDLEQINARLRESEERFRAIFEAEPECIKLVGTDGRIEAMNPAGLAMVGACAPEDAIGRDVVGFIAPEYRKAYAEMHRAVLQGEARRLEFEIVGLNGTRRWMETSAVPFTGGSERTISVLGITRDITERKNAECEIKESREQLRAILDSMYAFVGLFDLDGNLVEVNQAPLALAGLTREQALGRPLWETYWWSYSDEICETMRDAFRRAASGEMVRFDAIARAGEDAWIWVDVAFSALRDSAGAPLGVVGSGVDISDRKNAENELRESELRFRQIAETIREVFWVATPREMKILYVSPAFDYVWGFSAETLYSNPRAWLDAVHPDDHERIVEQMKDDESRANYEAEYRIARPDGTIRWIRDRAFPILDESGALYRIAGIAEDITSRKQAETTLHESAERLRVALMPLDMTVFSQDRDLRYTWFYEAGLQRTRPDAVGRSDVEFFGAEAGERMVEIKEPVIETGRGSRNEIEVVGGGGTRFLDLVVEPLVDDCGVISGITGASIDVTENREIRSRLEQSLREKETLIREVHHRVKNNLQIVASTLLLQSSSTDDPVLRRALDESRGRVASMAMVHELLDQSNDFSRIDFRRYVERLVPEIRAMHGAPDSVRVETAIGEGSMDIDRAIPLGLVITELMTNSFRHAFPDGRKGTVSVTFSTANQDRRVLEISDDGVGLSREVPWGAAGTLGHRLVEALARQLQAEVEIAVGPGTRFRFSMRC